MTRATQIFEVGICFLFLLGCSESTSGGNVGDGSNDRDAQNNSSDARVNDGSGDSSVSSYDSSLKGGGEAGALPNACSPGEDGCTCGWSPALRLQAYSTNVEEAPFLDYDVSGTVVEMWLSQQTDNAVSGQLTYRMLDPSTEQWTEERTVAPIIVDSFSLIRDAQGSILLFARDTASQDWMGYRLDPVTHNWSEPSFLGIPNSERGSVITSPGYTYWVNYPVVSRFSETGFEPSRITTPESKPDNVVVDVDRNGNLVAAWTEMYTTLTYLPSFGHTASIPVYEGASISFYNASSQEWSAPERVQTKGQILDVAFAANGDAYFLYSIDGEQSLQKKDAVTGEWSELKTVPDSSKLIRTDNGDLYRFKSCSEDVGCTIGISKLDPDTDTWNETTFAPTGNVSSISVNVLFAGEHGIVEWLEDCNSNTNCSAHVSRMTGPDEWSSPITIGRSDSQNSLAVSSGASFAIGENGATALSWVDKALWPYDTPDKLLAVRYESTRDSWSDPVELDAIAGIGWQRVLVEPSGNMTALWGINFIPTFNHDGPPSEIWTSRYACRRQMPEGTKRDPLTEEPSSLPAPGCLDPADSGCGPCGWRAPQRIATDVLLSTISYNEPMFAEPKVGINSSGRAVVAWVANQGLYTVSRMPDGSWGTASLGPSHLYEPYVIVDDSGAALLLGDSADDFVWSYAAPSQSTDLSWSTTAILPDGQLYSSSEPPRLITAPGNALFIWYGRGNSEGMPLRIAHFDFKSVTWNSPPSILKNTSCVSEVNAKLDANGNVTVYWIEQTPVADSANCTGPASLRVLHRLADGSWTQPESLGTFTASVYSMKLAVDDQGNIGIVWSDLHEVIWAASYNAASGVITDPQQVSADDACVRRRQLVSMRTGAVVLWSALSDQYIACDKSITPGIWVNNLNPETGKWSTAESLFLTSDEDGFVNTSMQPTGDGVLAFYSAIGPLSAARLPSSTSDWEPGQELDGSNNGSRALGYSLRTVADENGNVLAIWQHRTGDTSYVTTLYGNRFDAAPGSWSEKSVAISQDRGDNTDDSTYDLAIAPAGTGILSWSMDRAIWATVFTCDQP
jgi:hypothetical protein